MLSIPVVAEEQPPSINNKQHIIDQIMWTFRDL
jgi:hypothetical protein